MTRKIEGKLKKRSPLLRTTSYREESLCAAGKKGQKREKLATLKITVSPKKEGNTSS